MNYQRLFFTYSLLICFVAAGMPHAPYAQGKPINRMGSVNTSSFDDGWLFARYGLQPDGTRKEEPSGLEAVSVNDTKWQKLDLPHDWAITGPFRIELEGATGKLPWKGIGWYRKHFTVPQTDAGKQIFVDFDGAMANAKIWLNGKYVGTWPYGYTSFRMDLIPFIQPGKENILAVRLDTENWDSRWYRSVIKASEDELCFITVKVNDKDGLMVPRSNPVIHFSIEGVGEIVATDNGDATSFIPFQSHDRPAFNGMALVIVKTKKGMKGKMTIKAESRGLTSAVVSIGSK